ncbi:Na+/H+ antiporter NhaC family protein [Caloranaerobacter ferrireducens]|uniref:Na+/H+ antiporter NhaC family protein n=1 Tax=Caloranaerobacter ferrireducens TaxID=1323370 RepID=UPI00084D1119|nr:Na+/H+ antiporter NhaC family protein [Caloranaerobacter ferrireducens]
MRNRNILSIVIIVLLFVIVAFVSPKTPDGETPQFGWLSLLPPLLAIVLAFITKQVLLSLFLGIFIGSVMLNGGNIFYGFLRTLDDFVVKSVADTWNAAILIFTLSIGGMIGVVGKMGGTKAIAEALAKKAKTVRSAQIVTWLMGIIVFFDDYANTLIVGPTMRPLTDKLKISREKLAYIVDSTAAPVTGMALISTWIGYEIGLIKDAYESLGIQANIYEVFFKTIPYRFYSIFALLLVFIIALKLKDFGPMYKAEKRARLTGKVLADDAKPMASDEITKMELKEGIKLRASNAIVPILTLIIVAFFGLWYNGYTYSEGVNWYDIRTCFGNADASVVLVWASIVASIVAIVMATSQKILSLGEALESWINGSKSLLITCIILVLAWSLGSVTSSVGTADFLVNAVSDKLPAGILPIIVFLISCVVAFATGTSWGTMAIVIPLALPLANSYVVAGTGASNLLIATLGAVLTGSIFGDHCSPISDTTIMSSMASASDHIDHVKTQIPYSLTAAGIAIIGYIIVGVFKLNPIVSLVVGVALLVGIVHFFGKSTAEEDLLLEANESAE